MKQDILYHYTSIETLFNILKNTEKENGIEYIKLRASYFMNMNDPNDCVYFINELSELLAEDDTKRQIRKNIQQGINDAGVPYFISLSSEEDSVPMWRAYAENGHGVAIGFDKVNIKHAVNDFQNHGSESNRTLAKYCNCKFYECYYWNQDDIKKEFIEEFEHKKTALIKERYVNYRTQ